MKERNSEKSLSTCVNNPRKYLINAQNATGNACLTLDKGNSVDINFDCFLLEKNTVASQCLFYPPAPKID